MEYVTIPGTGMEVSRVALGTWAIGGWMWGGTDEDESIRTIHAALDKGVNLVDTAPVYGFGRSEEIVGKALEQWREPREKVCISTKVALEWDDEGTVVRNSTRERILKEVEDSLKRLRTDYLDVYYIHWPDPLVPFEETAEVMNRLLQDGKVRAIGVSNYSQQQMDTFRKAAPINLCQPPYNIFERQIEEDVKPYCEKNNIGLMTYGALCRGLLSGKMTADREFTGDDLRKVDPKFQQPRFDQYLNAAEKLDGIAHEKYSSNLLPFAVRWVLDKGVQIALWGGRHPHQMDALPEVFGWSLDNEDMERIDRLLEVEIRNPAGPEFMAPPNRKEADLG
ncbi:aldo/keto reductase [Desulfohalovibrio reitneri]|uniref:aldo/keto reductase n=1 Tax=Desulfohalovibrio reitneri TaxID=1307759 RepID=UPI0004A6EA2A|nr:aldo/keto reductase [Desulfohalovibrio reitneri]